MVPEEVRSPSGNEKVETVLLEKDKKETGITKPKPNCACQDQNFVSANPSESLPLSQTEISISKNVIQPGFSRAIKRHRRGPGPNS